jgi:hypothetical protein
VIPARVVRYRDPAAVAIGLSQLRRRGLTPRGVLFLALDPRGETLIAIPENPEAFTTVRVGDKMTLEPPWEGRLFHFDAIHRLPGDTVLWNGDRRLSDTGSAPEVAVAFATWLKGFGAKNIFTGCTAHQPGSWWTIDDRASVSALHAMGIVDAVVTTSGLLARRIGERQLFHLTFQQLAEGGATQPWTPVFESCLGNVLLIERRVLNYRLVLTCERGLIEIDVSGLPESVTECAHVQLDPGLAVVGRITDGAFAVTSGDVEPWGLANVSPAQLIGGPNETLLELPAALANSGLE